MEQSVESNSFKKIKAIASVIKFSYNVFGNLIAEAEV